MTYDEINKNIIKNLGIDKLPKEKQQDVLERLGAIIYQEVISKSLDLMDDDKKDEFVEFMEKSPDPISIITFLSEKIDNLDEIVQKETKKLHEEVKDLIS